MDFFERQDQARRHTKILVVYFFLAVALTMVAIYLVFALIFLRERAIENVFLRLWSPSLFLGVSTGTLMVILLGSLTKSFELRQGGSAVATLLGGRRLDPNTQQAEERKLLNVVEEMAIASGTPVPDVFLLSAEQGINAFAAGHSPQDAAIGVTAGCMKLLNRDELQGVIGHEFSHILNGDMKLNLQLMGLVNGLIFITIIGRTILFATGRTRHRHYCLGARSRGGGSNPLPLIGLALMVIGAIGALFGRLIKSAVSRQREFLADAASVQFTRNPDGLTGALKKIGGLSTGSRLRTARAEQASHMFFGNGLAESWFKLAATHPPLPDRIRAIDPTFDGTFPPVRFPVEETAPRQPVRPTRAKARPMRPPALPDLLGGRKSASAFAGATLGVAQLLPQVGAPTAGQLVFAANFRESLSAPLAAAVREPSEATAVICALLLSAQTSVRAEQMKCVQQSELPALHATLLRLQSHVEALAAQAKLPLVTLCLPALRRLSAPQFAAFQRTLKRLIESDREVDLFEYTLLKIVHRHLEPAFQPSRRPVIQYYSITPLAGDGAVLLSALARIGHTTPADMEQAFREGASHIRSTSGDLRLLPVAECGLPQIDAALNRLAQAAPAIKKSVLTACARTVAADGVIQANEAELLRAIGDTLDCPIPPIVRGV